MTEDRLTRAELIELAKEQRTIADQVVATHKADDNGVCRCCGRSAPCDMELTYRALSNHWDARIAYHTALAAPSPAIA